MAVMISFTMSFSGAVRFEDSRSMSIGVGCCLGLFGFITSVVLKSSFFVIQPIELLHFT